MVVVWWRLNGANITTEKEEKARKDSIRWPAQKGRVTGQGRKRKRGLGGSLDGCLGEGGGGS